MQENKGFSAFNLGNSDGFSVMEIINGCEVAANRRIPYEVDERRKGDPSVLVAENSLAKSVLGWKPAYYKINEIIDSAWNWHKKMDYKK